MESQKQEIETIKERTITLKLSDADCDRIAKKAGMHGLTVGELLENFIGDLVDGTYSNGSDERDRANEWFERCGFSFMYEQTLLRHLLDWDNDIDDFLTVCDEMKYYEDNPEEYAEQIDNAEEIWFLQEYQDYTEEFLKDHKDADMEKEIKLCRKWYYDLQTMKGENE